MLNNNLQAVREYHRMEGRQMALVTYENISKGLGKITLNDPENLNAMGEDMANEFAALIVELKKKAPEYRALILTGAGRAFSAGGHLEMLDKKRSLGGERNRLNMLKFYDSFLCLLSLNVPLIAAINGHAIGAGLCLATACDVRVASDKAKLGFTFTRLGLHPGMGATYFLPRVVGIACASELLLTGRVVEAPEALRIGLVGRITAGEKVLDEAKQIAAEICECGPEATRQLLESLRGTPRTLSDALQREALAQATNYVSAEFAEGLKAAQEKRKANFA